MKTYTVYQIETIRRGYEVKAESEQEAIQKVQEYPIEPEGDTVARMPEWDDASFETYECEEVE